MKKNLFLLAISFMFLFLSCSEDSTEPNDDKEALKIVELQPSTAFAGMEISIIGTAFGNSMADSHIEINDEIVASQHIGSWKDTVIVFTIPDGTITGDLRVIVGGKRSNAVLLTIADPADVPVITTLSQGTIQPGLMLNIFGEKFGDTQGNSYVLFGSIKATNYASWENTRITVEVPMNAKTGDVWVVVNGLESNRKYLRIDAIETVLEFVEIPAGSFIMGKDIDDPWDVAPAHQVTIDFNFYMSTTEITQGQWKTVMAGSNPSKDEYIGDNKPVQQVTWYRAVEFCNRLSEMENLEKCYTINGTKVTCDFSKNGWRLPTEAEWEYCCRAGNTGDFGGTGNIDEMGWCNENSGNEIHDVAQKKTNDFGLYDMHGNVYEWCWDWYETDYYSKSPELNPKGSDEEIEKVLRGGSFINNPELCTSWIRKSASPALFNYNWGFRVVKRK